jgi:GT2 family glycosyltransferase/glycosyltransferase involved in cell wall biosynthesis/uncharacterized membrane-anchored protein YhcB (DUF1043 family)
MARDNSAPLRLVVEKEETVTGATGEKKGIDWAEEAAREIAELDAAVAGFAAGAYENRLDAERQWALHERDKVAEELEAARAEIARLNLDKEELQADKEELARRADTQGTSYDRVLRALSISSRRLERIKHREAELSQRLAEANARADQAAAELQAIQSSALIRAAAPYRQFVESLAPANTRRRRLYSRALRSVGGALIGSGGSGRKESAILSDPIVLPVFEHPLVTIVIPVHGQWQMTADCLRSIANDTISHPYRVVVVNDASPDETGAMLAGVEGVEVIRFSKNRGFLHAVNAGIEVASGSYVVLLNNDTIVQPGWLDALVDMAEQDPWIGLVGSKLVYPDGRLQEAGGIIFRDASGWNYGRNGDPNDPAYNFPREVDYCSAASVLVRREILETLGGFDTRYAPAYYEDTDLAFATRELGYRVVYQPESVVIHREGASHGTDTSSGIKAGQVRNQAVFRDKWAAQLAHQFPPGPEFVRLASRRTTGRRVLIMDYQIPTPDQDSGSRRMYELVNLCVESGLVVTFVPMEHHPHLRPYAKRLEEMGVEVEHSGAVLRQLLTEIGSELSLVILSRPAVAWPHLPLVRELAPKARLVYDTVDLHFVRERRRAEIEHDPEVARVAELHREMELTAARAADATLVVSTFEKEVLESEIPGLKVRVLPNIHADQHPGRPFKSRRGLLFVGSFPHPPNRDAAIWFVEEILGIIRQELGDVPLNIVGSHPTEEIRALGRPGVNVLGWVPDLTPLYEASRVFVAPLRYGAGMKGKVGESLSHGLPVVTTRIGAEGMGLVDGVDVLIGDDAASFARAVVRAYKVEPLWNALASAGRRTVADHYSPAAVRPALEGLLSELGVIDHASAKS